MAVKNKQTVALNHLFIYSNQSSDRNTIVKKYIYFNLQEFMLLSFIYPGEKVSLRLKCHFQERRGQ